MSVDASWSAVSAQRGASEYSCGSAQVTGRANEKFTFEEETRTLAISAHGALMRLATAGEQRPGTGATKRPNGRVEQCKIVYLSEPQAGGRW